MTPAPKGSPVIQVEAEISDRGLARQCCTSCRTKIDVIEISDYELPRRTLLNDRFTDDARTANNQ
jgi:hypothetical protein